MECIYEVHDMVPKTFCKEMIEKFESDSRTRQGQLGNGDIDTTVKNCVDLEIGQWPQWELQNKRLRGIFITALRKYVTNLRLNVFGEDKAYIVDQLFNNPNTAVSGFQMQRYGVGGFFKWHVDFDPSINRVCNYIIYLNDHEACTEFLNGKKIKPETGKIVFFPTTWVHAHCGQPVVKGNKFIITGFIFYKEELTQSLPFIVKYD
jgi:hypothetical protein